MLTSPCPPIQPGPPVSETALDGGALHSPERPDQRGTQNSEQMRSERNPQRQHLGGYPLGSGNLTEASSKIHKPLSS